MTHTGEPVSREHRLRSRIRTVSRSTLLPTKRAVAPERMGASRSSEWGGALGRSENPENQPSARSTPEQHPRTQEPRLRHREVTQPNGRDAPVRSGAAAAIEARQPQESSKRNRPRSTCDEIAFNRGSASMNASKARPSSWYRARSMLPRRSSTRRKRAPVCATSHRQYELTSSSLPAWTIGST